MSTNSKRKDLILQCYCFHNPITSKGGFETFAWRRNSLLRSKGLRHYNLCPKWHGKHHGHITMSLCQSDYTLILPKFQTSCSVDKAWKSPTLFPQVRVSKMCIKLCFPTERQSMGRWKAEIAVTYTFKVDGVHPLSKKSCRNPGSSFIHLHHEAKTFHFRA